VLICASSSFADVAAMTIVREVVAAIQTHGHCALALAGGSTPRPVYEHMSQPAIAALIDWPRVAIYFGDERFVPPDDPNSNYRMACEALLTHVPLLDGSIHRMEGERRDPDAAARAYERVLPARLDVLLLGVGADGHTASIFPRSPVLDERIRRVRHVPAPATGPSRLTITPLVIGSAARVIVLVAGTAKADVVARALEGPYVPGDIPAQLALGGTWIIDHAAAARLRKSR
jgi:6-phosphogluconolactonase